MFNKHPNYHPALAGTQKPDSQSCTAGKKAHGHKTKHLTNPSFLSSLGSSVYSPRDTLFGAAIGT